MTELRSMSVNELFDYAYSIIDNKGVLDELARRLAEAEAELDRWMVLCNAFSETAKVDAASSDAWKARAEAAEGVVAKWQAQRSGVLCCECGEKQDRDFCDKCHARQRAQPQTGITVSPSLLRTAEDLKASCLKQPTGLEIAARQQATAEPGDRAGGA